MKKKDAESAGTRKKTRGRKSKYSEDVLKWTPTLCQLGATNKDLAQAFNVSEDTIYEWKRQHAEFSEAIKKSGDVADAKVVKSLFKLCTGYRHKAVKIFCNKEGYVTQVDYVEKYPPNIVAIIFWLCNRRRDEWKRNYPNEIVPPGGGPGDGDTPLAPPVINVLRLPKPEK